MNKMYFIAHVLPPELDKKILVFKQKMHERFLCTTGLKSPAHITLIPPFWMNEEMEDPLKTDLDVLASSQQPFNISTAVFNRFQRRTIFIEPEITPGLKALQISLAVFFGLHKEYPAKPDDRPFHPHITIATRDLQQKDFAAAWALFENKKFEAVWKANAISLLSHNKKNWDVIHTSQFNS